MEQALMQTDFKELKLFAKGKVRDVYDLDDKLLIVATDRISAFDVVLPNGIPGKGKILTQMSIFWFNLIADVIPNHLLAHRTEDYPAGLQKYKKILEGRSMLVKKAKRIDIECVVRGYISGSLWKEYKDARKRAVNGEVIVHEIEFPDTLSESDKLPQIIFTPATKAEEGHDENISFERMCQMVGKNLAEELREKSLKIYQKAYEYALQKGIIIADTKFEFGLDKGKIILIDEIFSPDSSRFWSKADYKPGHPQDSFDKQYIRDYLESIKWDKTPPGPKLPDEIVQKTLEKYEQAYRWLVPQEISAK
ncbi:MAG: phosphoribosylaminoimidazolesuccinocarboxamide synthase [candidate division Zixibacteria bacterium RBG_16_48_11]|nr:MAG: phosphoribosylaminoimidazolesuccinocarboxamide synthase [candidate division Zixibacteria bacterium RBG_16_48_11]